MSHRALKYVVDGWVNISNRIDFQDRIVLNFKKTAGVVKLASACGGGESRQILVTAYLSVTL